MLCRWREDMQDWQGLARCLLQVTVLHVFSKARDCEQHRHRNSRPTELLATDNIHTLAYPLCVFTVSVSEDGLLKHKDMSQEPQHKQSVLSRSQGGMHMQDHWLQCNTTVRTNLLDAVLPFEFGGSFFILFLFFGIEWFFFGFIQWSYLTRFHAPSHISAYFCTNIGWTTKTELSWWWQLYCTTNRPRSSCGAAS